MTELKPCPNPDCGGDDDAHLSPGVRDQYTHVYCMSCDMCGPMNDPAGEKWNALPRCEADGCVSVPVKRNATEKAVLIGEHKLLVELYDPEEEENYLQEFTVPWDLQKNIIRDFIAIYQQQGAEQ